MRFSNVPVHRWVIRLASISFLILAAQTGSAITMETVPIGDVGNPSDPATGNHFGSVNYDYQIGRFEVTVGQYTAFLNAVAATDTYNLYAPSMATDLNVAGIARSGASGSFTYSPIGSPNHPVAYISWGDAARFANWLHNGQPTGPQGPGTTETGAYALNGATTQAALTAVVRNPDAKWFIPNENEWYKAAYYQPAAAGGDTDGYWAYPTRTNLGVLSDQPPGTGPAIATFANYFFNDNVANNANDGYAVTGSPTLDPAQNYLTDVGAYPQSASYYGTFDQGGNIYEWIETIAAGSFRVLRGGYWGTDPAGNLAAGAATYGTPSLEFNSRGFRVAFRNQIDGDYNVNGVVDAGDYVLWRKSPATLPNEGATPGVTDAGDYTFWRSQFGLSASPASGLTSSVPEPITNASLLFALAITLTARRAPSRRRASHSFPNHMR